MNVRLTRAGVSRASGEKECSDNERSDNELDGEEEIDADAGSSGAESDSDSEDGGEEQGSDPMHRKWCPEVQRLLKAWTPGDHGFRCYAQEVVRKVLSQPEHAGGSSGSRDVDTRGCRPLQEHQRVVSILLQPSSPVTHLLVDQPTGSGKTREMIEVLDNFFFDRRAKVPMFPRAAVCRNFYEELLRWPSRYRDFFCFMRPERAAAAAGAGESGDWRSHRLDHWTLFAFSESGLRGLCAEIREVLEMKSSIVRGRFRRGLRSGLRAKYPGCPLPGAPLRALTYASAGGMFAALGDDGLPLSAVMKFGYRGDGCVYSHKVILLDEAHNLVRAQTMFARHLAELRRQLLIADGCVLAGFTGTPLSDSLDSGRLLLDVIKGRVGEGRSDEGFLVSLAQKTPPLFPQIRPQGVPDTAISPTLQSKLCPEVELRGEALRSYDAKLADGASSRKLKSYCNIASYCCSFHGQHRTTMLGDATNWMPKLAAIAAAVCHRREKAAILISRQGGYSAMVACMRQAAAQASPPFGVATGLKLAEFNAPSNARGQSHLVLVADSGQFCEGASFRNVRWLYLGDVPDTAGSWQQQCGRVARMFGHHDLPAAERSVTIVMPIATVPLWMREPLGAWAFRTMCPPPGISGDVVKASESARRLLEKLQTLGIKTLGDLQLHVQRESTLYISTDATDSSQTPPGALSSEAMARLLRRWGVADPLRAQGKFGCRVFIGRAAALPSRGCLRQASRAVHALRLFGEDAASRILTTGTADEVAVELLRSQLLTQAAALDEFRKVAIQCDESHSSPTAPEAAPGPDCEDNSSIFGFGDCFSSDVEAPLEQSVGKSSAAWQLIMPQKWKDSRPQQLSAIASQPAPSSTRLKRRAPPTNESVTVVEGSTAEDSTAAGGPCLQMHDEWIKVLDEALYWAPSLPDDVCARISPGASEAEYDRENGEEELVEQRAEVNHVTEAEQRPAGRKGKGKGRGKAASKAKQKGPRKRQRTDLSDTADAGLNRNGDDTIPRDATVCCNESAQGPDSIDADLHAARCLSDEWVSGRAAWMRFTPANIDKTRCLARTWACGQGGQCTGRPREGAIFCNTHTKDEKWRAHGRVDGEIPEVKLRAFLRSAGADGATSASSKGYNEGAQQDRTEEEKDVVYEEGGRGEGNRSSPKVKQVKRSRGTADRSEFDKGESVRKRGRSKVSAESNLLAGAFVDAGMQGKDERVQEPVETAHEVALAASEASAVTLADARDRSVERNSTMSSQLEDPDAASKRFTPAQIDATRCLARTWAGGRGGQCAAKPAGGAPFCPVHSKDDKWRLHGRVDGTIPAAKLREFVRVSAGRPQDQSL